MNINIAGSRLACLLGGEGDRVRERLRHALGRSLARQEIARLAKAAFAYRAMARRDERRGVTDAPYRRELARQLAAIAAQLEGNALILPASTRLRPAVESPLREDAARRGYTWRIMSIPAPEDAPDIFAVGARELGRAIQESHDHVVLLRVIRTGLFSHRVSATIKAPGAINEALLAEFLGDCLRENPAQYDWFLPASIFTTELSATTREHLQ